MPPCVGCGRIHILCWLDGLCGACSDKVDPSGSLRSLSSRLYVFQTSVPDINGVYRPTGTNHSHPVFTKISGEKMPTEDSPVVLYYWDTSDGEANSGWWVGSAVGAATVWAHNPAHSSIPPRGGWHVTEDRGRPPFLSKVV